MREDTRTPQINMAKLAIGGGIAGAIFAFGSMAIFLIGIPAIRYVFPARASERSIMGSWCFNWHSSIDSRRSTSSGGASRASWRLPWRAYGPNGVVGSITRKDTKPSIRGEAPISDDWLQLSSRRLQTQVVNDKGRYRQQPPKRNA